MAKGFTQTLSELKEGALVSELTQKLGEVVEAVKATERKGSLVLRLDITPAKKGIKGMVIVDDLVKVVLPEPERDSSTVMFATEDGSLSRRDPRQPELPGVRGVVSMPAPAEKVESNG